MGIIECFLGDELYTSIGPFVIDKTPEVISLDGNWSLTFPSEEEFHGFGRGLILALAGHRTELQGRWAIEQVEDPTPLAGECPEQFITITLTTGCEFVIRWAHALYMAQDYLEVYLDDSPFEEAEQMDLWAVYETAEKRAEKRNITPSVTTPK